MENLLNQISRENLTEDEFLDAFSSGDKYSHLKVILSRRPHKGSLPQTFLLVTKEYFEIVNLIDLDYKNGKLYVYVQEIETGDVFETALDIEDQQFKFLLINLRDLKKLIDRTELGNSNDDSLLELDE